MPRVIYNGNGNTGGSVPVDSTNYASGSQATVLGNTGSLVKNADIFAYWNDAANGLGNVIGPGAKITMGGSDITLYASWYTTSGLTGGGTTTHYQFRYDSALATAGAGNIEPARTNQLISRCEGDFSWMKGLFNNIELPYSYPVSILVANLGGGASWGPPITLKGGGGDANLLRDLMVAEVTEMFMFQQNLLNLPNHGYGFNGVNDEESNGEGLSHYLMEQFEIRDGRPTNLGGFNGNLWLNSSLPSGTPGSTRYSNDNPPYDYGSRYDYVNNTINDNRNTPASGCSVLFLWYLTVNLGFNASQICQAASPTLGGVYKNLTGDNGDPFPLFKNLLDNRFPSNVASSIPGSNPDNPFPLALLSFWVDKSSFGRDEVLDVINTNGGRFENAFWLVLEGFNKDTYLSIAATISAFTGSFKNITELSIVPSATYVDYENDTNSKVPQRIRLSYDIIFTMNSLNDFPAPGSNATQKELNTSVTIGGNVITGSNASTVFELVSGADPYFTNINPSLGNTFWLSQDLRVFTVTPGLDRSPFGSVAAGKPTLNPANNTNLDTAAGFQYAQNLITYLNNNYSNPAGTDPFSLLPGQGTAFSDASSVARYFIDPNPFNFRIYQNYNFAIARVRLRGTAGPAGAATNVKVFFRLWKTQTPDTTFGSSNYPSTPNASGFPETPLPGAGNNTIPFFATGNYSSNNDYTAGGNKNNRTVQINTGDSVWAYFVCYLNLYDSSNVVNGESVSTNWAVGTHHCLVAEIAYDQAPILTTGLAKSPENSDKLAQRNLQLTFSDNPGNPATHRIPQTFDVVPSLPLVNLPGMPPSYPDELMIDWGGIPVGSIANIYWPQVNSSDVINLATSLYGTHFLSATDGHTIQCKVTKSVTYIPVPVGSGENFAGLFTVDLPPTVIAGQEYNILVRKVSTHGRPRDVVVGVRQPEAPAEAMMSTEDVVGIDTEPQPPANPPELMQKRQFVTWRYVTGTFQVRIPVTTRRTMLLPEQNTLAIMKARLQAMSPANRWYPVLQRYIAYISARVDGLGGDSASVKPSFQGYIPGKPGRGGKHHRRGKDRCCREGWWFLAGSVFAAALYGLCSCWKEENHRRR
jgi:hypothetical protein